MAFFIFPKSIFSASLREFQVKETVTYTLDQRGSAQVKQNVTLINNFADIYPREFIVSLPKEVANITAHDSQGDILKEKSQNDSSWTAKLLFNRKSVGKGEKLPFEINYFWPGFAQRRGRVWHFVLPSPQKINDIDYYQVIINVPDSFHNLAHSSIKPASNILFGQQRQIIFNKKQFEQGPIALSFADFQAFDFSFRYQLKNSSSNWQEQIIPLPPVTNYQNIIFKVIDPNPFLVNINASGNWLAHYRLAPHQQIDVVVGGQVLVFPKPERKSFFNLPNTSQQFLASTRFWPAANQEIQLKAESLKTARNIYNFVTSYLHYKLAMPGGLRRRGGLEALRHPQNAVCTEFTDLFISLARAAGIPAREIEGYAYTNNPKLRPGGFQVLHAWPEYWDKARQMWIEVDPTWGNTTGGIDYFSSLDLNHFALVIHGQDDSRPAPPGSYSSEQNGNNFRIAFTQTLLSGNAKPKLNLKPFVKGLQSNHGIFWPKAVDLSLEINNRSLRTLINTPYDIYFGKKLVYRGKFDFLPLFGKLPIKLSLPPLFFLERSQFQLHFTLEGQPFVFTAALPQSAYMALLIKLLPLILASLINSVGFVWGIRKLIHWKLKKD